MYSNQRISEQAAVLGVISPVSQGAGTISTGWISARDFRRFTAIVQTGVLGASATVDAKLEQATSSGGAGVKDVSGKAITQIVKASGDDAQAIIDLRDDELDMTGGFSYFRLSITVAAAASLVSGQVLGGVGPGPASDKNVASVAEIVA
jgi:hypothetical protein